MLEELQRRNYAKTTVQYYLQAVERFAKHFRRPPDQLNQDHLRAYQAYLLRDRKLEPRTVKLHVSALRRQTLEPPRPAPIRKRVPAVRPTDTAASIPRLTLYGLASGHTPATTGHGEPQQISAPALAFLRFNAHTDPPRPPQTPAASF